MADGAAKPPEGDEPSNFLRKLVKEHLDSGEHTRVGTRFPPEPNGYLHIGHAKSICLNFGLAAEFGGTCNLRFDDTNPTKEDIEYVESIQRDIQWLGFEWSGETRFASDYFDEFYRIAEHLVEHGHAYVCDLNEEQMREYRGTVTEAGKPSPRRDTSPEENLDLLRRMKAGEFDDGTLTLRAKIDMANPNMKMRDPPLYRIRKAHHYRTGDAWCIYPMYDFAHCLSDAIEGITHSICTLEFENNRELYDWLIERAPVENTPRQYEFARLFLSNTVMSKRKFLQLLDEGKVRGWDDPRMPTIAGLRRRGFTADGIQDFCERIGVARANSLVDVGLLEHSIRNDLNHKAPRVMSVLRPLKVTLTNYPEGKVEELEAAYWPHDVPKEGSRQVPFSRELYIERDDFAEDPPKKWFRLAPGREVRLRYGYFIRCEDVVKNDAGEVVELRCTYDAETKGGNAKDGRKVKGTLHWVAAAGAVPIEVRLVDRLFNAEEPRGVEDFNPDSLEVIEDALIEPSVVGHDASHYQFERLGFFVRDPDSTDDKMVFNRTVSLKDTWAKVSGSTSAPTAEPVKEVPAAPQEKRVVVAETDRAKGYVAQGLSAEDAVTLDERDEAAAFFDATVAAGAAPGSAANWVLNEVLRLAKESPLDSLQITPVALASLVALVDGNEISSNSGKKVLGQLAEKGGDPVALVDAQGLRQQSDASVIGELVTQVLADNPEAVEKFKAGRTNLAGFLVGQVMKASRGKANPQVVSQLVNDALKQA